MCEIGRKMTCLYYFLIFVAYYLRGHSDCQLSVTIITDSLSAITK